MKIHHVAFHVHVHVPEKLVVCYTVPTPDKAGNKAKERVIQ